VIRKPVSFMSYYALNCRSLGRTICDELTRTRLDAGERMMLNAGVRRGSETWNRLLNNRLYDSFSQISGT
jgi:hypothetical protein